MTTGTERAPARRLRLKTGDVTSIQYRGVDRTIAEAIEDYRGGKRLTGADYIEGTWRLRQILLERGMEDVLEEAGVGPINVR